jgi:hypothetical protein
MRLRLRMRSSSSGSTRKLLFSVHSMLTFTSEGRRGAISNGLSSCFVTSPYQCSCELCQCFCSSTTPNRTLCSVRLLQNGPHGIGLCRELGLCHASDCAIFFGFQLGSLQLIIMLQQYIMTIRGKYVDCSVSLMYRLII